MESRGGCPGFSFVRRFSMYSRAIRLEIAPDLSIDEAELDLSVIEAGGPDGQNVN